MIEDALKSARNLHRLIMTVTLVTLVFALSLDLPRDKVAQREAIGALIEVDFLAYDRFVAEKVEAFREARLAPLGMSLTQEVEATGHMIFNLDDIGEAFAQPIHVGKLLTADTLLADVGGASLTELYALNGLDLAHDVQVVVPRMPEITREILTFLDEHPTTGKRIDEIRLGLNLDEPFAQSFLPGEDFIGGVYFELVDAAQLGGAPVFSASFVTDIETVPNSSFVHWVETAPTVSDRLAVQDNGDVSFAPALTDIPTGFREQKLGLLHRQLGEEIASAGPEKQSATILGTKVPGLLIVIASPLTLFVLGYYFASHTGHLKRLSGSEPSEFKSFAWMPLAIRKELRFGNGSNGGGMSISGWAVETAVSTIVLPLSSFAILYRQLTQFGELDLWTDLTILIAAIGVLYFGIRSMRNIRDIRGLISLTKPRVKPPTEADRG